MSEPENLEPAAVWLDPKTLSDLEGSPNPRENEKAVDPVGGSIGRFGFLSPIVARRSDRVIAAGHTRWKALARGDEKVRVVLADFESDDELRAFRLADNGLGFLATWSATGLRAEVNDLHSRGVDVRGLGWKPRELEKFRRPEVDRSKPPRVALSETPDSKPGEVYELGPNLLVCGDSTDLDLVRAHVGEGAARCVFTDPPFAIYGSSTGIGESIADDKMVRPMFREVLRACELVLPVGGAAFVCCDWRSWPSWWEVAKTTNLVPKNKLIWTKFGSGLGSNFGNSYEEIGYFAKAPPQKAMTAGNKGWVRPILHPNDLGDFNRPTGDDRVHNAQKPVELVAKVLELATEPGELVVDFFGGSGTTLLEGHRMQRRVVLFEIDPKYADLIRRRWTDLAAELGEDPGPGALDG